MAQANVVTGSPIPHFVNQTTITLSTGTPTFTSDLTTYGSFSAQLHDLVGVGTNYPTDADVEFQSGTTAGDGIHGDIIVPYAMTGRAADGKTGGFIWKFVMAAGTQTGTGAKVNFRVYFRSDPSTFHGANASLAIYDSLTLYSDISGPSPSLSNVVAKKTAQDIFGPGNGDHTYTTDPLSGPPNSPETLAIPAGLTEFYVVFQDQNSAASPEYSSARWALNALSVDGAPVATPEPATLASMAALGVLALKRRR